MAKTAETLAQAKALQQAGDLAGAERLYREVLAADATSAEACYFLATIAYAQGKSAEALHFMTQALVLRPEFADGHHYRGALLAELGKLDDAIVAFNTAARLKPDDAGITQSLRQAEATKDYQAGNAWANQGLLDLAAAAYRRALERNPSHAHALGNLGTVLGRQDKLDEALDCYRRALAVHPDYYDAQLNLSVILERQQRLAEAAAGFQAAIQLRPQRADGYYGLGNVLARQKQWDEAARAFRRALEFEPEHLDAALGLAAAEEMLGRFDDAVAGYRRVLARWPDHPQALSHLGAVLARIGELDEAIAHCRRALVLRPGYAEAHHNLGLALAQGGHTGAALASYQQALAAAAAATVHSSTLLAMHYLPEATLPVLAAAHESFAARHAGPLRAEWQGHANDRRPERPLRVGLLSADFGIHPVSYFLLKLLENLDPAEMAVTCYSDRARLDAMTDRLRGLVPGWRDVRALSDADLAAQLRADGIDVAIDLAGHTAGNRLLVLARKPAPVQITWCGYVGTTGVKAIDYLLADRHEVPPAAEPFVAERVLRMPDSFLCYSPPGHAPTVAPPPALEQGYVTFGSFNNPAKLTPAVIEAWAAILKRVANSRLILKYAGLERPAVRQRLLAMFAARHVPGERVELQGWTSHEEYLAEYRRVDVALDPFPYNGSTTTCETLWMGVPLVSCPGETFASRHSLSYLSSVGLEQLVARDAPAYVELAVALAGDLPRLAALRAEQRQRMAASPLCDGPRFAAHFTRVLREAWRAWCAAAATT